MLPTKLTLSCSHGSCCPELTVDPDYVTIVDDDLTEVKLTHSEWQIEMDAFQKHRPSAISITNRTSVKLTAAQMEMAIDFYGKQIDSLEVKSIDLEPKTTSTPTEV